MHIDFALPVNHNLMAGFEEWKKKAAGACADYGFHMAVTSWSPKVASDMEQLVKHGINSFKFFMAYKVGAHVRVLVSTWETDHVAPGTTQQPSLALLSLLSQPKHGLQYAASQRPVRNAWF